MSESKRRARLRALNQSDWVRVILNAGVAIDFGSIGVDIVLILLYMYSIGVFGSMPDIGASDITFMAGFALAALLHMIAQMLLDTEVFKQLADYSYDETRYTVIEGVFMMAILSYLSLIMVTAVVFVAFGANGAPVLGVFFLGISLGLTRYSLDNFVWYLVSYFSRSK